MESILLAVCIACTLFTLVTAIFSVLSFCKVVGLEKSTHQVQYIPVDNPHEKSSNDLVKDFQTALGG